jgi:acetylornithine deacetylase/succinyl-diaminopimelate desuccinylase-like protein
MLLLAILLFANQSVANRDDILREFKEFLSIPNVASDSANIRRNADWLTRALQKRGVATRLLEAAGSPPVVYGELKSPKAKRTFVFYAHYDGQPVDRKDWITDPFGPVEQGGRVYARGSSDDKGPIVAMLAALDRLKGQQLEANLKFFFEGEEEAGSPHLAQIVRENRDLLKADAWFICDGPVHPSGKQQLYFGVRGVAAVEVSVYGPLRELHSGHYGNWAPNPAMMLAQLLAAMKDESGRVLIPHFYDGVEPLGALEKKAIAEAPDIDGDLKKELGLVRTEGKGQRLVELINQPSLNIRGMSSAGVGSLARNVVPSVATASLDLRLVKGLTTEGQISKLIEFIRKQGYFVSDLVPDKDMRQTHPKIARVTVDHGYNSARTPMDLPISREVVAAVEKVRGSTVKLPTMGGSVPLVIFEQELRSPWIGVPMVNHDNNQHAANENVRLQNLWDGIDLMVALMRL